VRSNVRQSQRVHTCLRALVCERMLGVAVLTFTVASSTVYPLRLTVTASSSLHAQPSSHAHTITHRDHMSHSSRPAAPLRTRTSLCHQSPAALRARGSRRRRVWRAWRASATCLCARNVLVEDRTPSRTLVLERASDHHWRRHALRRVAVCRQCGHEHGRARNQTVRVQQATTVHGHDDFT
jgi:hypothetical protein